MTKGAATSEQLDKLLDRLGSDPAFREKMLGDPVSALAEHGVEIDPSSVPAVRRLPSSQELATQRESIKSKVEGRVGLAVFLVT
jgi:putative modified peptide